MKLFKKLFMEIVALCVIGVSGICAAPATKRKVQLKFNDAKVRRIIKYPADQYGSKTANLEFLEDLTFKIQQKILSTSSKYKVLVPSFVGIPDLDVVQLFARNNLDVEKEWKNIVNLYNAQHDDAQQPDTYLKEVENLGSKIKEIFKQLAPLTDQQEESIEEFIDQDDDHTKTSIKNFIKNNDLEKFIGMVRQKNGLITVRSTGREDTDEVMNAGGNESKEVVQPNVQAVIGSMADVIPSYASSKSFKQREKEHDDQLLQRPLFAVLIQEVVGEINGCRVVSGVAYTQESRGDTPNIAMVQATHGHGKAVVDNLAAVDTYYLNCSSFDAHQVVSLKTNRFVPLDKKLVRVANEAQAQKQRCLDDEALQALSVILTEIQAAYGKPMDVEFVVNQEEKIIYLVQARPRKKTQQHNPSYFSNQTLERCGQSIISCSSVNYIDGALRVIRDPKEIIVAQTLNQALNIFLFNKDYAQASVVIVQGEAELLSHAGAIFSGADITILTTPQVNAVKKLLERKGIALFLDVQRGIMIDGLKNDFLKELTIEELKNNGLVIQGYCKHPIPSMLSIQKISGPFNQTNAMGLIGEGLNAHFENVKDADQEEASAHLNIIQQTILDKIDELYALARDDKSLLQATAQYALGKLCPLAHELNRICSSIKDALYHPARSIERLYPITFLEALLFQQPKAGIIRNYSYQSIMNNFNEMVDFIDATIKPLIHSGVIDNTFTKDYKRLHFAKMGTDAALANGVAKLWIAFLSLSQDFTQRDQDQLMHMLADIQDLHIFQNWLNTRFVSTALQEVAQQNPDVTFDQDNDLLSTLQKIKQSSGNALPTIAGINPLIFWSKGPAQAIFDLLFHEYYRSRDVLGEIKKYTESLDQINIRAWQEDSSFDELIHDFETNILQWFTGKELKSILDNDIFDSLNYQAAIALMNKLIAVFDAIIKSIKSISPNTLDIQIRAERFKCMVGKYLALLNHWAPLVPKDFLQYHEDLQLSKYLGALNEIFHARQPLDSELYASPDFNVIGAALGGAAGFERAKPITLEDLFTTVHQSLLAVTSALNLLVQIPHQILPSPFKNYCNFFNNFKPKVPFKSEESLVDESEYYFSDYMASCIGIDFENNELVYRYNIPLRTHSMNFTLRRSNRADYSSITFNFFGWNECDRWDKTCLYAEIIANINHIGFVRHELTSGGTSFSFYCPDHTIEPNFIGACVTSMIAITMQDSAYPNKPLTDLVQSNFDIVLSILARETCYLLPLSFIIDKMDKFSLNVQQQEDLIQRSLELIHTQKDDTDQFMRMKLAKVFLSILGKSCKLSRELQEQINQISFDLINPATSYFFFENDCTNSLFVAFTSSIRSLAPLFEHVYKPLRVKIIHFFCDLIHFLKNKTTEEDIIQSALHGLEQNETFIKLFKYIGNIDAELHGPLIESWTYLFDEILPFQARGSNGHDNSYKVFACMLNNIEIINCAHNDITKKITDFCCMISSQTFCSYPIIGEPQKRLVTQLINNFEKFDYLSQSKIIKSIIELMAKDSQNGLTFEYWFSIFFSMMNHEKIVDPSLQKMITDSFIQEISFIFQDNSWSFECNKNSLIERFFNLIFNKLKEVISACAARSIFAGLWSICNNIASFNDDFQRNIVQGLIDLVQDDFKIDGGDNQDFVEILAKKIEILSVVIEKTGINDPNVLNDFLNQSKSIMLQGLAFDDLVVVEASLKVFDVLLKKGEQLSALLGEIEIDQLLELSVKNAKDFKDNLSINETILSIFSTCMNKLNKFQLPSQKKIINHVFVHLSKIIAYPNESFRASVLTTLTKVIDKINLLEESVKKIAIQMFKNLISYLPQDDVSREDLSIKIEAIEGGYYELF